MTDLLTVAASGLAGYRAALEVMGENVANANSEGFARRDIQLRARAPGSGYPLAKPAFGGLGVDIAGVRRAHDAFLSGDARDATADRARLDSARTWLSEIEMTFGSGEASVGPAITDFYNTASGVAADPGSTVQRNLFLRAADTVASRFRTAESGFGDMEAGLTRELGFQVNEVNDLTRQLAQVNDKLRRTPTGTGASGGLMDERDRLLDDISRFVKIEVREGDRGTVSVRLGDGFGPELIRGGEAFRLTAASDGPGLTVRLAKGGADVRDFLGGGAIAGLMTAARQLERSRTVLDGLATDFATAVNGAHALGVDLAGAAGEPLFALETVKVTGSPANTGSAALRTTVADGGVLDPSGYRLFRDGPGGVWYLERGDGSASITGPGPLTLDGLTLDISGEAADADNFVITPAAGAAGIALRIEDPEKVAAAAPFLAGPMFGNVGSGRVSVTADLSAALPVLPAYRVVFTTVSDFEIQDTAGAVLVAAQPYTPGAAIAGAGFSFTIDGAPVLGDRFEIQRSVNAAGDATAMRGLLATRAAPIGISSFEERWERETGRVASRISEASSGLAAAEAAQSNAIGAREARAGVDLDSQAADLIRFQQAYQAAARAVQSARDIFDTMLGVG